MWWELRLLHILTKDILDRNFIGNKYDTWNMQYWLNDELVILYYNPNDICICKSIDDPEYAYHDLEWLFDVNNVHTLQNILKLFGIDKELVGAVAAKIRSFRRINGAQQRRI